MILYVFTFALLITQLLDWYSTRTILHNGGYEQNAIAKRLMSALTMDGFLALKAVVVTGAGYWLGAQVIEVLLCLTIYYVGIVIHNWQSMR